MSAGAGQVRTMAGRTRANEKSLEKCMLSGRWNLPVQVG
jgi:hypothetical protein